MNNPWLRLSLADYEGHMGSVEVQQLAALSDLFAEALAIRRPASVAILGVAGGNGLDRIDGNITKHILALDFNPRYLDAVRQRYASLPGLEFHCVDLAEESLKLPQVDLVHAALVFEHAGVARCLDNAVSLVRSGGALSVALQLPAKSGREVGVSPFPAIQSLASHFSLIDPESFRHSLESRDFRLAHESRRSLPAGKAFWMGIFARRETDES